MASPAAVRVAGLAFAVVAGEGSCDCLFAFACIAADPLGLSGDVDLLFLSRRRRRWLVLRLRCRPRSLLFLGDLERLCLFERLLRSVWLVLLPMVPIPRLG